MLAMRQAAAASVASRPSVACRDPGARPELRIPDAAAQTRMVSVAGIQLNPGNLSDLSKGYFATTFLSSSPTTSARQCGLFGLCPVCKNTCDIRGKGAGPSA